jgi:hypothetical protein
MGNSGLNETQISQKSGYIKVKKTRMEGWRGEGMKGWRGEGMKGWRGGGMEG